MMVELRPAYVWDCEECGRENFHRGLVPELSAEERYELLESHGLDAWEAGAFVAMPERVICSYCGSTFQAAHFGDR
jgi:hypothetical protein